MTAKEGMFGELVRKRRQEARLTMGDVADHLGFTVPYVSDVERGRRSPYSPEKIYMLAVLIKTDPIELLAAAAVSQGAFKLNATNVSDKAREVGAALMRGWSDLNDDQLEQIGRVLSRRHQRDDE